MTDKDKIPARISASEILKSAFVDAADARLPLWIPIPGLVITLIFGAFMGLTGESDHAKLMLSTIVWPGSGIFLGVTFTAWLGWQLEID
jgi:hypothetical protein